MIGRDKWGHFIGCAVIAAGVGIFSTPLIGAASAVFVGALKELLDTKLGNWIANKILNIFGITLKQGTPSWPDFLADIIGALVGALLVLGLGG